MKTFFVVASLLFLAASAQAQTHGASLAPAAQLTFSGGSVPAALSSAVSFSLPVIDRSQHDAYVYEQGSSSTFEPTRFVSYETAMKLAKEALAYRPKSIVEVAAECRAARKRAEIANGTKE